MAVIHPKQFGKEKVPQNTKLWAILVAQAKHKFHPYPSLPASRWLHEEYIKRGGIFVDSKKKDTRHKGGKETRQGKKEREQEEREKGKD